MKTLHLKKMSLPKIAVLATGLTAALLVATMSPQAAQAHPTKTTDCSDCHSAAASGPVTALPSLTALAAGAAYTVLVTPPVNPAGGDTGFRITDAANVIVATGGDTGTSAATYTASMTAPATTGTFVYTVWAVHGAADATGMANFTTYSITVGSAATTTTPPPASSTTTTTTPPASSTTTTTEPPASSTTTTPPATAPGAPTDITAVRGDRQAIVSWKAPTTGSPIVGYAVFPTGREDLTVFTDGPETSITVPGLTNGKSYTFSVVAVSEAGLFSADSAPSNAVTPLGASTAVTPVVAGASAVIPVGAPNTGAGGASGSTNGPLAGLGGLALLLAGAGATQIIRRRQQV